MSPPTQLTVRTGWLLVCDASAVTGRSPGGPQCGPFGGNDLVDDPEDLVPGVDAGELVGHLRGTETVGGSIEHGAHRLAQRFLRWLVGCEIDPDAGPRNARIDVGLVFGQSRGDQWNAKAHG